MIESREKETKLLRQDIFIISTFSNTIQHVTNMFINIILLRTALKFS